MNVKVAIAEDNPFLLKSVKDKLSFFSDLKVKYDAENGKILLEKLADDHNIDIILMDIQMPDMNGIKATELIKTKYPQIKIMMLTVFDDDENIFMSIKSGADGYILKETDPKSLYKSIQEILSGGAAMTPCIALKALKLLRNHDKIILNKEEEETVQLSDRQIQILEQLSKGLTYTQISENLYISPGTVRKHIENIYKKLQAHSKIEALQKAQKHGIL